MAPDVFDDLDVLRATTPQLTPKAFSGSPRRRQRSTESFARIPYAKGSRCISTTLVVLDGPSCSNLID